METFELPGDLKYNRGAVEDPSAYISASGCASWLFLTGEEFASMPGGISYGQVQRAISESRNVVSDPPRVLDVEFGRRYVKALNELPRPTMITCRAGPRASAVAYMYSGLKLGADPDDVIAAAERDEAPFCRFDEYKAWVRTCMETLKSESAVADLGSRERDFR